MVREIERQVETPSHKLANLLRTAHRIYTQQRHDKNKNYSVHEPEVQCIAKGKACKQYEIGNKGIVAVSSRSGWFVGANSLTGNPYDGHTLAAQMKQVESLIANKVSEAHGDMGYRGHDDDGSVTVHIDKRRRGKTSRAQWRWMKRRAAVEPSIGHLKSEHRLERNRLKGDAGNAIRAVSIHLLTSEDRARWHFLEENATQHSGFCKEKNRNRCNAILAAAAMNFHKLLGAFWRIFLFSLMSVWNGLLTFQAQNTQLQYA